MIRCHGGDLLHVPLSPRVLQDSVIIPLVFFFISLYLYLLLLWDNILRRLFIPDMLMTRISSFLHDLTHRMCVTITSLRWKTWLGAVADGNHSLRPSPLFTRHRVPARLLYISRDMCSREDLVIIRYDLTLSCCFPDWGVYLTSEGFISPFRGRSNERSVPRHLEYLGLSAYSWRVFPWPHRQVPATDPETAASRFVLLQEKLPEMARVRNLERNRDSKGSHL